jgi:hypothetical protein
VFARAVWGLIIGGVSGAALRKCEATLAHEQHQKMVEWRVESGDFVEEKKKKKKKGREVLGEYFGWAR